MNPILEAIRISYGLPALEKATWDFDGYVKAFEQAGGLLAIAREQASYGHLTVEEGREIALAALERYDAIPESTDLLPQEILTNLAKSVPDALKGLTSLFLERHLAFAQEQIFREADAPTRDKIIALLESGISSCYKRGELLSALAWIGDETVQVQFQHWRTVPPAWQTAMHYPPEHYVKNGGWELTPEGARRNLYYSVNYDLVEAQTFSAEVQSSPVEVLTPHEGVCGWCVMPLLTLFDINLTDSRMRFLGIQGTRLRLALCPNCSLQAEPVFTEVDGEGTSVWSKLNGKAQGYLSIPDEDESEELLETFPQQTLVLGPARRTPYIDHGSHLGGCPSWVQNADYPCCLRCQRLMTFVGQYLYNVEAYIYAFLCASCGIAATNYQQT
ncbi:MAG TPA: hypothetical protein VNG51_13805 [Ktedonobacteraceae bacterium]|nr:hypothetical protein [Ktedonobacteraceae bacterium]